MAALPTTTLGRTGLEVTNLGYGAMELRRAAAQGTDVGDLLNRVLDSGINFIDTSPDYGPSEELIGEHLSSRRDEFYLASKCGCVVDGSSPPARGIPAHEFTPETIRAGVEQSLRRMNTDHLDLVQFHASPSRHGARGARRGRCTRDAATRRQDAVHRDVGHVAQPARAHRDGCVRRVPDPVFGART